MGAGEMRLRRTTLDGHESLKRAAWLEEPAPSSAAVEPAAVLRLVVQQSCVLVLMTKIGAGDSGRLG